MIKKHSSFFLKFKRIIMCFMVLFMFEIALAPRPAYAITPVFDAFKAISKAITEAIDHAKEVLQSTQLGKIVMAIVDLISLLGDLFQELYDQMTRNGQWSAFAQRMASEVDTRNQQAMNDAVDMNNKLAADMRFAQKAAPPKHEYLCKAVMAHSLATTTEDFERELSRMTAEAISNRYRCPTCNGLGGDFLRHESARRRERKYGSPLDGYPSSAIDTTLEGTDGRSFDDADIAPIDGSLIYEVPEFVRVSYTDRLTGESLDVIGPLMTNLTDEQRFFIAAWDNIFHLAGARPTPVHGKAMLSESGKRQRAMFNHCSANQNALVKQCTDLLSFYTRPNRNDSSSASYRRAQYTKCHALEGIIDLERFGNCDGAFGGFKGLSPYETQLLAQTMCKTNQNAIAQTMSGASQSDVLKTSDLCTLSWNAWQAYVARKHSNCTQAVEAMHSLQGCWAATAAAGGGGVVPSSTGDWVKSSDYHRVNGSATSNDNVQPDTALLYKIGSRKVNQGLSKTKSEPSGRNELPQAVGQ